MERRRAKVPLWALARDLTEEALGTIASLMRDEEQPGSVRLAAADKVLERAWGKAPIIVAGDESRPICVDVRSLDSDRITNLEAALVQALGQGIQDTLNETRAHTGAILEGRIVPGDSDLPASEADITRTNLTKPDEPSMFPIRSPSGGLAAIPQGGGEGASDQAEPIDRAAGEGVA